jgi:hypothetical protein
MENNEVLVGYARGPDGPVRAGETRPDCTVSCYGCGCEMHYRSAHERTLADDRKVRVVAHFVHARKTACRGGESPEHWAAKHAVAHYAALWRYSHACRYCRTPVAIDVGNDARMARGEDEFPWQGLKLDAAHLAADGALLGAVEVYKTHRNSPQKVELFTAHGVRWVEVDAMHVLAALRDANDRLTEVTELPVMASSAMPDATCAACHERLALQAQQRQAEEARRLQEREAEVARRKQAALVEQARQEHRARLWYGERENVSWEAKLADRRLYPQILNGWLRSWHNSELEAWVDGHHLQLKMTLWGKWYLSLDGDGGERDGRERVLYDDRLAAQHGAAEQFPPLAAVHAADVETTLAQWEIIPGEKSIVNGYRLCHRPHCEKCRKLT